MLSILANNIIKTDKTSRDPPTADKYTQILETDLNLSVWCKAAVLLIRLSAEIGWGKLGI